MSQFQRPTTPEAPNAETNLASLSANRSLPRCISVMSVDTHSSFSGSPSALRTTDTRTSHHLGVPAMVLRMAVKRPRPPLRAVVSALSAWARASPSQRSDQTRPTTSLESPTSIIRRPQALMNVTFPSRVKVLMLSAEVSSTLRKNASSWFGARLSPGNGVLVAG